MLPPPFLSASPSASPSAFSSVSPSAFPSVSSSAAPPARIFPACRTLHRTSQLTFLLPAAPRIRPFSPVALPLLPFFTAHRALPPEFFPPATSFTAPPARPFRTLPHPSSALFHRSPLPNSGFSPFIPFPNSIFFSACRALFPAFLPKICRPVWKSEGSFADFSARTPYRPNPDIGSARPPSPPAILPTPFLWSKCKLQIYNAVQITAKKYSKKSLKSL